jgi:hypothetical protein
MKAEKAVRDGLAQIESRRDEEEFQKRSKRWLREDSKSSGAS